MNALIGEIDAQQDVDKIISFNSLRVVKSKTQTQDKDDSACAQNKIIKIDTITTINQNKQKEEVLHVTNGIMRKRNDGRWEIRTYYQGKRVTSAITTTQNACVEKHSKWLKAHNIADTEPKVLAPLDVNIMLFDWLDRWLELKKPLIEEVSWKQLEICVRLHIKTNTQDMPLKQFKILQCQDCISAITSSRMREYSYNTLFEALKWAVQYELILRNPCDGVKIKKHVRKRGEALRHEQQEELLRVVATRQRGEIYKFYILTGCRPAEGLRAKWEHIDYEHNTFLIDGTKTEESHRVIPLFPQLKELLDTIPRTSEYIFDYSKSTQVRDIAEIMEKLSFTFTLKDLRHTFATRCSENGIPIHIVQKWLGHTSIKTTEKTYVHVLQDFEKAEASKFDPFIHE